MSHEEKARAIFGARAASYVSSESHADPQNLDWVVKCAKPSPFWKGLDVATGTGHTALALAPYLREVVGLDLTREMLAEAEKLRNKRGIRNVSFKIGDVHQMPFQAGTFDLVTARRAAHHFSDIRGALTEIHRVMKPGARLVIDDRSVPEDEEVDRILNQLDELHDGSHVRQYRPSEWRTLLKDAGFSLESLEPFSSLRPISHMKAGAAPRSAAEIDRVMAGLTARQQSVLQTAVLEGELHHLHFFVMIAATKAR